MHSRLLTQRWLPCNRRLTHSRYAVPLAISLLSMTIFWHFQNNLPAQSEFNTAPLNCSNLVMFRWDIQVFTCAELGAVVTACVGWGGGRGGGYRCWRVSTEQSSIRLTKTLLIRLCSQECTLSWQTTACTAGLLTQHRFSSQATTHMLDSHTTKVFVMLVTVRHSSGFMAAAGTAAATTLLSAVQIFPPKTAWSTEIDL